MAAGLPLPKRGSSPTAGLLFENDKMSKVARQHRALRAHSEGDGGRRPALPLLREVVFGQDGSFSYDALIGRYNSDLANGLSNLASRTLTMIDQASGGVIS